MTPKLKLTVNVAYLRELEEAGGPMHAYRMMMKHVENLIHDAATTMPHPDKTEIEFMTSLKQ